MRVLVCGGAGYIGSHTAWYLKNQGHDVVVFDNLSTGHRHLAEGHTFVYGDLLNPWDLKRVFQTGSFDCVMHFAAFIAVGESVTAPHLYYRNNVTGVQNLLDVMMEYGVKNLVFSSTAAIFGQPDVDLIDESVPKNPINPYGRTKWFCEQIFSDYAEAFGLHYVALRYFNACGRAPGTHLRELHDPETHLIPLIVQVAEKKRSHISIFGSDYPTPDGTCIRDYIHVLDLAQAHEQAMHYLSREKRSNAFNLGNGAGHSVEEVIQAVEKVYECPIERVQAPRREGDPARLVASSRKAREILGWNPEYPELEQIVQTLKL